MNKQDIEESIISIFGNKLKPGSHYNEIKPNENFEDYNNNIDPLDSRFFYLVCNGGNEQEFNGDLSYRLHNSLYKDSNSYYVLRERIYTLDKNEPKFLTNSKGKKVYKSKVDIVAGNVADGLLDDSAIMLGHNFVCQSETTSKVATSFLQKVMSELNNLSILGFKNNFFVALLSDIDIKERGSIFKYEYYANKRNNHEKGYVHAINDYRNAFRKIDPKFIHLIFKSEGFAGYDASIYLNIFIIKKDCTFLQANSDD